MSDVKKIALLSNVTVDLIVAKLRKKYDFYTPEGFDTWIQEVINPSAGIFSEKFDAVVVLLDGTEARSWKNIEEGTDRLLMWKQAVSALTDKITDIPIFISTIDIRENRIKSLAERRYRLEFENEWYQFVQLKVDEKTNTYLFDMADIVAEIGRKQFYSNKIWYMSSCPYSRDGINAICCELERILNAVFKSRKKIITLDLDNTLWGGVIGEDGIDGIELSDHKEGQRFFDFQRQFLEMKNRGTVLAINSKNNPEDAELAIQEHPAMLLRDDDFVIKKINWENKAVNLKAISNDLNITEGGFIFIDDNPVEQETIKGECPEVYVPEFPKDTTELISFAEEIWLDYCMPLRVLGEDLKKTQMYQNEARRKQEFSESLNLDDYISKLQMVVDIHLMRPEEEDRVVQLINKTNQFNVTTKRYTQAEISQIKADKDKAIYVVYSSDKYGDSGLISVIILDVTEESASIDSFLMSCRVMGRKLENVIINELAYSIREKKKMIAEYIPTAKNVPVKDLFVRLGFDLISESYGHKYYEKQVLNYEKEAFDIYKEIKFEG